MSLVMHAVPATLYLAAVTLGLAIPIAVTMGCWSAMRPNTWVDRGLSLLSMCGVSIADFWLALMLVLIFGVRLRLLPTSGYGGIDYVILPAATLLARPAGRIAQIARAALVDELRQPYTATLRAKGMTTGKIVFGNALKNAALPIATITGDELAGFLNSQVIVGTIFAWPGIGSLFIGAIQNRDLPLVEACVFVIAILVIVVNLAVDLTYAVLDPRIRLSTKLN
jgi:peptide/nickel transport system permease protein